MARKDASDLLLEMAVEQYDESVKLARFAESVLREARDRTTASIARVADDGMDQRVSISHSRELLNEIERHLAVAQKAIVDKFRNDWTGAYKFQHQAFIREIAAFEKQIPSGIPPRQVDKFSKLSPRISSRLFKATMDDSLGMMSKNIAHLREPIRRIVAVNITTGASYSSMIRDIAGAGITKGPFKTAEHRARAIAITETTNITNAARYESLADVNEQLHELSQIKIQWLSLIDGKTSARCKSLHRQVREQGQDFQAKDGWRGKMPAAHPHCRSQIVPWKAYWQPIFDDLERKLLAKQRR